MNNSRCRRATALPMVFAVALASCTDSLAPRDDASDASASENERSDILGGGAALDALAQMLAALHEHGRGEAVPDAAREIIERAGSTGDEPIPFVRPDAPPLLPSSSESLVSGPYSIDGVTYYEQDGVFYPPLGTSSHIVKAYTTGSLSPGRAEISAGFEYMGHDGTQATSWRIRNPRTGDVIREGSHNPFGSHKTGWANAIKVFAGHLKIYNLPQCDMRLTAQSSHESYHLGGWVFDDNISIGVGGIGIRIIFRKASSGLVGTGLNPPLEILCPDPDPEECESEQDPTYDGDAELSLSPNTSARLSCGGDGGSDDEEVFWDDPACLLCQQWFLVQGDQIIAEWWECWEEYDARVCDAYLL